jgi:hypothetical protein
VASAHTSFESSPANPLPALQQPALELHLHVTDREVIAELEIIPAGPDRNSFALSALRLGVLAMRQARGELDAGVIRQTGEQILHALELLLKSEGNRLTSSLADALRQYFDKDSGQLPQRLESLLKENGEFDQFLRQHIGPDSSTLSKTLEQRLQPLIQLLDPEDAKGIQAKIGQLLEAAIQEQRDRVLAEFSLDRPDSALSRLLGKLTDKHGELTKDVRTLVDELAKEFSLDKQDSALSRLVKKVEDAQGLIGKSLTLDDDNSPMARLKRELQATIESLTKSNAAFQEKVLEALAKLQTQRETAAKSTLHGLTFEDRLGELHRTEAARFNDVCEAVGTTTGAISYCKTGDFVVTLGPDSAAPDARIVWEAKSNKSYDLASALKELEQARKNRKAQVGVFVFAKEAAPSQAEPFARYGNDIIVVWDPEDPASDLYVKAAYSVARALVIRETHESAESKAAVAEIEKATLAIEKQLEDLGQIKTWADTVMNNGEKISKRAGKLQEELSKQVETLNSQITALKSSTPQA